MNDARDLALRRAVRRQLLAAGAAATLLLGGAGVWAGLTNLAGAVVAQGQFVVASHVKSVQHPTGGVIGALAVQEGARVAVGDVLIRLDDTQTRAGLAIVTRRLDELAARMVRLAAERDGAATLQFPQLLTARQGEPGVAVAIESERRLFAFRRQSRAGQRAQLEARIAQYEQQIVGLKAQEAAADAGLEVLEREIADLASLQARGIVTVQRLNTLRLEAATLGGDRGEAIAGQAGAAGGIAEARLQILQIDADLRSEVGQELREVQAQIGEFSERRIAAQDQLARVEIRAPQAGVVHDLAVHTTGGVISPAETLMQIVPEAEALAVDLRLAPADIDQVHPGQLAMLRLSALNLRTTPEIPGRVERVAADLTEDPRTGAFWYGVRVTVAPAELARLASQDGGRGSLGAGLPVSGMPVEVHLRTAERTALSYLVKPLRDQFARAFREE